MTTQPTRGATEATATRWAASPVAAGAVRLAALGLPVITAWLAVRLGGRWFWRPEGRVGAGIWLAQAVVLSVLVSVAIERWSRRLLPLAMLLNLSLVFPDQAPSRFGVALRAGSPRHLKARLEALTASGPGHDTRSAAEAAEAAMELVAALSSHDRRTRGHTERVRAYAELIGQELGLSDEDRLQLAWGVLLHDVGKLNVPAHILNKQEPLTDDEWQILRQHPAAGRAMLAPLAGWLGPWMEAAGDHHERWDGKGYPDGRAGTDISLAGRITAVADAYDVITSARSYKAPMSITAARQELVRCSGSQFDPAVVRAMLAVSVGRRWNWGPLAWIAELPQLGRLATGVAQSTVTVSVASSAMAVGAIGLAGLPAPDAPEQLAMLPLATVAVTTSTTVDDPDPDPDPDPGPGPEPGSEPVPAAAPEEPVPAEEPAADSDAPAVPPTDVDNAAGGTTTGSTTATTAPAPSPTDQPPPPTSAGPGALPPTPTLAPPTSPISTVTLPSLPVTVPPVPPVPQLSLWLTNPGTSATGWGWALPLGTAAPTDITLLNFDTDRDSSPGLRINRDSAGLTTSDGDKRQDWYHLFDSATSLKGPGSLTLHLADKDLAGGVRIGVRVALYRCLLLVCSSPIATGTWTGTSQAGGFKAVTVPLGSVDKSLPKGYSLRLRVVVPDDLSDGDVAVAYDTVDYPSALTIG